MATRERVPASRLILAKTRSGASLLDLAAHTPIVSSRPAEESCDHASAMPTFDAQAAEGLGAREVRLRWPRFEGSCPTCGARVLCYASFEHYLAGDW